MSRVVAVPYTQRHPAHPIVPVLIVISREMNTYAAKCVM